MDIKRTYFQNRLTENELRQLLTQCIPFFLENVTDVDTTASSFAQHLRSQGLTCQVRDHRRIPYAEAKEIAAMTFPLFFGIFFFVTESWRYLKQRLKNRNPQAVIIQAEHALDIRFHASK